MCVYLTDVPISNVLLSAQSRCFCMYCNFSFDLRLLLCIVSKAYQARCCACVLNKHSFLSRVSRVLTGIFYFTPISWIIQSAPSELLSVLEKQVMKEEKIKGENLGSVLWKNDLNFTAFYSSFSLMMHGHHWHWVWACVYTSLAFSGLVFCPGFKKKTNSKGIFYTQEKGRKHSGCVPLLVIGKQVTWR